MKKENNYWNNIENCKKVSLLCKNRRDFSIKYSAAYSAARKNKWLDEICSHMPSKQKPKNYWTKEKCLEISILYKNKKEFMKNNNDAYKAALKLNCLDEICSHMIEGRKPNGYWTKQRCIEEALKYTSKSEWYKNSTSSYIISRKNKWLKELSSHMINIINNSNRIIYSFEFEDKSIYIGLTCDIKKRYNQHLNKTSKSTVLEYIKKTKMKPKFNILTYFMSCEEAQNMEITLIEYYRNNSYNILNKVKGGNLGGSNRKNDYEKCKRIALNYKTKNELLYNKRSIYNFCKKNNWLDIFYPNEIFNFNNCKKIAKKFKNRNELHDKYRKVYNISKVNNWLDIFYPKN